MTSERISDTVLILPAAGSSVRFGADKLFYPLDGMPVFLHPIRTLAPLLEPGKIVLAVHPERLADCRAALEKFLPDTPVQLVPGGVTRTESVLFALREAARMPVRYAAVHDAARPFLTREMFLLCLAACRKHGGALLCRRISDTVKRTASGNLSLETLDRDALRAAETPQIFLLKELLDAYEKAAASGRTFTDDAQVMEEMAGMHPYLAEHEGNNRKITFRTDLA